MKKFTLLLTLTVLSVSLISQTQIATVNHSDATANHNQRKIVRDSNDNIYVVFVDWVDQTNVIKGLHFDRSLELWSDPVILVDGYNPTIAISPDDEIYLLYESNAEVPEIIYTATSDFLLWSAPQAISESEQSCKVPVADVDSAGNLNVLWQQRNADLSESLIYAHLKEGELIQRDEVITKNEINDIAIANDLRYDNNTLFFALNYNQDSVQFCFSSDLMDSYSTIYSSIGSQPCISYNSNIDWGFGSARFLYINESNLLCEIEAFPYNGSYSVQGPYEMPLMEVTSVCIDDIAPPIGYSFISQNVYGMVHTFSYGFMYNNWSTNLEFITGNGPSNPSIAYKHFNPEYVDFIWMDEFDDEIYYMRDAKYIWTGLNDPETGKGFSITGSPNPFVDKINLRISTDEENVIPELKIYNLTSQLVTTLPVNQKDEYNYNAEWQGTKETGVRVEPGVYVIVCSVGKVHTARKVVVEPEN